MTGARQSFFLAAQGVVQYQADKYRQTRPMVVQEGIETGHRLAVAGFVKLPGKASGRRQQAEVEVQAQLEARRRQQQTEQRQTLENDNDQAVGIAKQNGG